MQRGMKIGNLWDILRTIEKNIVVGFICWLVGFGIN